MITAYDGKKYATFEEWKAAGYSVMRGMKSYMVTEDNFIPLFCETQVERRNSLTREHSSYVGARYPDDFFDEGQPF